MIVITSDFTFSGIERDALDVDGVCGIFGNRHDIGTEQGLDFGQPLKGFLRLRQVCAAQRRTGHHHAVRSCFSGTLILGARLGRLWRDTVLLLLGLLGLRLLLDGC